MSTPKKEIKTPIKGRRLASTPLSLTPQTPTVDSSIRRRVSDILLNLHKCVQIWERDNQASFNTANTLANLYGQWNTVQESESLDETMSEECKRKYHLKLLKTREDILQQLKLHQNKLNDLIAKMNTFLENIKAIYYLGIVGNNSTIDDSDCQEDDCQLEPVIFSTWPTEKFIRTIQLMLSDYTKEYLLKTKFYEKFFKYRVNSGENTDTNVLTECLSVWLHQPYISDESKVYLDAMLIEAELK